ncbi:hypothetical protein GCM10023238_34290 [Streptomyces heliomycini]
MKASESPPPRRRRAAVLSRVHPCFAHVSVRRRVMGAKGDNAVVGFKVTNERATTPRHKLEVTFPTDHRWRP